MNDLDESMVALIEGNGLIAASVCCHSQTHFTVDLQWEDGNGPRHCVIGHGKTTALALGDALEQMRGLRFAPTELAGGLAA